MSYKREKPQSPSSFVNRWEAAKVVSDRKGAYHQMSDHVRDISSGRLYST